MYICVYGYVSCPVPTKKCNEIFPPLDGSQRLQHNV